MTDFQLDSWGYQIDFYHASDEELNLLSSKLQINKRDLKSVFLKSGNEWIERISGMTFNLKNIEYYPRLKKYLDYRLNMYLRKLKLLELQNE